MHTVEKDSSKHNQHGSIVHVRVHVAVPLTETVGWWSRCACVGGGSAVLSSGGGAVGNAASAVVAGVGGGAVSDNTGTRCQQRHQRLQRWKQRQ